MAFELQPLPYSENALEPYIDAQTMGIHHGFHHGGYVKNLNTALEKHPDLHNQSIDDLIRNLNTLPEGVRNAVRNNGGGHFNHSIFWTIMGPNAGGEPTGAIATLINEVFGDFENFKTQFNDAGAKHFGSGFVWLVRTTDNKFEIVSLPNQDCPWSEGHYPILCNDVWEHAYYLTYQNRRPEYLKQWWNTVNWNAVNERYNIATSA
ncbi:MAG: superoxide dismutase [Brasilonema octagenarum HA4186-MV1]|jgi:Fe-Mn family superoxide dismutase|uniref:Superoxide dismutase n=2 Tax=Brasilonema TaxID=383614 RepID=A0A856MDM5_9CYAN|nr:MULTISPECIES: superoxide dismutase [Brasilonema]MBW4630220.1 superoxide dismutase [Brasilonema octagenarum HA4186-MV1]NMF66819.1 superoxide dismutase [Brasilonema octagenarum UFV-OR1]QDL09405.1 superoxide dismutase [Brasilonema sennae CENA114]QDL15761.1 superoxide dismutase [Brasilonema octagenarum UFV-E1]